MFQLTNGKREGRAERSIFILTVGRDIWRRHFFYELSNSHSAVFVISLAI